MVHIGLSLKGGLENLAGHLEMAVNLGMDAVELSIQELDLLYDGHLHDRRTRAAVETLSRYPLKYSVHQPKSMNLRNRHEPDKVLRVMLSCMEFCRLIGSRILVVHYEKESAEEALERQFADLLLAGAGQAGGVTLAVENIEIERSVKPFELVERLNHPAVRMTYDIGHDFLASSYYGYDYAESAARCAKHAVHLHVNDNFGQFEEMRLTDRLSYNAFGQKNWSALGKGDLHLPIGWGAIPYETVVPIFKPFDGLLIAEVRERFYPGHAEEIAEGLRRLKTLLEGDERHEV